MASVQVIKNVIQHEAGCQVKGFLFCYVGQYKKKKIVKGKARNKVQNEIKEQERTGQEKDEDTTGIPACKVTKFSLFTFAPTLTTFFEDSSYVLGLGKVQKVPCGPKLVTHYQNPGGKSNSHLQIQTKVFKRNLGSCIKHFEGKRLKTRFFCLLGYHMQKESYILIYT